MAQLIFMVILYWLVCKLFPDTEDEKGDTVFIPFENMGNNTQDGSPNKETNPECFPHEYSDGEMSDSDFSDF